jgi:Fe-S oxidoreductase
MKILLVVTADGFKHHPVIPLGIMYIADSLQKNQHNYDIIDLNFHGDTDTALIQKIENCRPDVIGISIRNIAETSEMNDIYERVYDMVSLAQKYAKVVLGGAGFSIFPKTIMRITGADYGIIGSGEEAMIQIIKNLESIALGSVISGGDNFIDSDISSVFKNYWTMYEKYFIISDTAIPIQTIRGCELSCRYCSYPSLTNHKVQKRSISLMMKEIQSIIEFTNRRLFYFVDAVFNMDLNHTKSVLKAITDCRLDINFGCCINPKNYDEEMICMMQKAGCTYCEVGVDSFSDSRLKDLNKGFDKKQTRDLISQLEKKNIPYSFSLVLGGLGETEETLSETIRIAAGYSEAPINAFIGERIYPRTPLAKILNIDSEEQLHKATKESVYINESLIEQLKLLVRDLKPPKWNFTGELFLGENL